MVHVQDKTVGQAAIRVLETSDAREKATLARYTRAAFLEGTLSRVYPNKPKDRPSRPDQPELLAPGQMPRRRKGGTLANRTALIHAVAHIELNAIDLAFDMIARFGASMPDAFTDDWLKVGDEEGKHFLLLSDRLSDLGSHYGALPAHDGLWQAAYSTRDDLAGRLAVVPMVLEARGLDVTPDMIARLRSAGDNTTAEILEIIYSEEVGHVEIGSRWFHFLTGETLGTASTTFQSLVKTYFKGALKPPFNRDARDRASLPYDYYAPLADFL